MVRTSNKREDIESRRLPTFEQQDYENFFKKQIYLIAKLFAYFMEHLIIFIGYSLSDGNIKSILYSVKQILIQKQSQ
ncbi:SIR2 family protein [Paenibacillus polymyxa]|uniref:SIR2 family protein n=1 Tax=Paenibacillus polymyxa TaxID=1406 RepID=UPI00338EA3AC